MKKNILLPFLLGLSLNVWAQEAEMSRKGVLVKKAENALEKGISFFRSLAIEGGYVYHQPPGTPAVGMSFLKAFNIAGNPEFLKAAEGAADALIKGQNDLGGWEHKIYFDRPTGRKVSFDDDQTQSAISFLMALDQVLDKPALTSSIQKALQMMIRSQLENGGWPHQYPVQGNYHDFATFNDQGINDCIRVMIEADKFYGKEEYRKSLQKVGRFMMISQLPPPQPGWAQQYNQFLQPAWARTFEPPAVCPSASVHNLHSLIDLYLHTLERKYLEPIPDALRWLKASRLPNGMWGRFLELGTNKALYYDRGRIRVDSLHQLSLERRTGYGYEVDLEQAISDVIDRFKKVQGFQDVEISDQSQRKKLVMLADKVEEILESQDDLGRWVVPQDKFRKNIPANKWNGEYRVEDRISSKLFNDNIQVLCEFLELYKKIN